MKNSNNDFGEKGINDIFNQFRKKRDEDNENDKFTSNIIRDENTIYFIREENIINFSIFCNSQKSKNINVKKMDYLERENKSLKEEIEKYKNEMKKLKNIIEKLKEKYKDNWNYSIYNNNETLNNEQYINNYSFNNICNDYSFNCSSEIENLTQKIYKGDKEVIFDLFLTNNGSKTWPEGRTKLVCIESSFKNENYSDVILEPQIPKQVKKYDVRFTNLKEYKNNEYISIFRFNIDGINIGEEIILTVIIDEDFNIPQLKGEDDDDLSPKSRFFIPYSDMNRGIFK